MFVSPQDFNKPPIVSARSGSLFEVAEPRREAVQVGEITETELRLYNGPDQSKPILISIKGQIYDVSEGRNFYGPGGSYTMFARKECRLSYRYSEEKLPLEKSDLVPIAVKEGFEYHHAQPGYVMLTYWIPEGPCMLPANASHQVGSGGFVINDTNEVLVVQEKHCYPATLGLWKIPAGFIHEVEDIYTGAVREVKEETGR